MLSERSQLYAILARHGLRPAKGLGQHFLADEDVLRSIAESTGAGPDTHVVEIGAGVGNLTTLLTLTGARVTAVELDTKFQPLHREIRLADEEFTERLQFHYGDALEFDYLQAAAQAAQAGKRFLVAGNIPYQITTPLIMKVLDSGAAFDAMTFLIQKEVAERLAAGPGTRRNSAISVKVHYDCEVRLLADVPAKAFLPPPEVDSQVIQFKLKKPGWAEPGLRKWNPEERRKLFRLVDAAFAQRRKMMSNSISASGLGHAKADVDAALEQIGFPPGARAEQLGVEDFLRLLSALGSKAAAE